MTTVNAARRLLVHAVHGLFLNWSNQKEGNKFRENIV